MLDQCEISQLPKVDLPSVEDVHERNRENIGLLGPGEVGDVRVERNVLVEVRML